MKDLYNENYKTLKKTQINAQTSSIHVLEDLILLKYHTTQSDQQIQWEFKKSQNGIFTELEKAILKFICGTMEDPE